MKRLPSVKRLKELFDDAKGARRLLEASREELLTHPANAGWVAQCYHQPWTSELRMNALSKLGGFYGVESFETTQGDTVTYLNAGDTYALTVVRYKGNYTITSWGDLAEKHNL